MARAGLRVGAVGPSASGRQGVRPFVVFDWFMHRPVPQSADREWVRCDDLIASGMLIPAEAWLSVGPMDESLFIDKVDTDWCLRAAASGHALAGAPAATLDHRLGEAALRVLTRSGWKSIDVHLPFRYYYIIRNAVLLARRPHATWRWRSTELRSSLHLALLVAVFSEVRWPATRMMCRGLFDGLRAKTGPLER